MATGDLLLPHDAEPILPAHVLIPPEDAATEALACYLRKQVWYIHPGAPPVGELSRMRSFQLTGVGTDWPDPNTPIAYPAATIFGQDDTQHTGSGTPRPIEDRWDQARNTVPWLLGIALGTLQVDFWTDSEPVRQAIAARLSGLFNPSQNRAGILLELPPTYLSLSGRFTLVGKGRRDAPDTVWAGEHRLRAIVKWEVPDVELRCGYPLVVSCLPEVEPQGVPLDSE